MSETDIALPAEPFYRSPTVIWLALMVVTIVTTWLLSDSWLEAKVGIASTFVLVAWKVRLILLDFMELRHAPRLPRLAFELWSVGVPVMIVSFYLSA